MGVRPRPCAHAGAGGARRRVRGACVRACVHCAHARASWVCMLRTARLHVCTGCSTCAPSATCTHAHAHTHPCACARTHVRVVHRHRRIGRARQQIALALCVVEVQARDAARLRLPKQPLRAQAQALQPARVHGARACVRARGAPSSAVPHGARARPCSRAWAQCRGHGCTSAAAGAAAAARCGRAARWRGGRGCAASGQARAARPAADHMGLGVCRSLKGQGRA